MGNHAKNQHYVPQALLKEFSYNDSLIWTFDKMAYDKNWKFVKERPIKKVASENYFYDLIPNVKEFSYEYIISEIERKTVPIIRKIIDDRSINKLSIEDKQDLSSFIALQFIRTKYRQTTLQDMNVEINEKLSFFFHKDQLLDDSRLIWLSLFNELESFTKAIFNKEWFLCFSDALFYTSDNPVVVQNSTDTSEIRGTLGLESYGIEIYLPLNSSILLCLFCPRLIAQFNGMFKIDILEYTSILNVNSLQFFQSERFIFYDKNDFSMITKDIV